MYHIMTFCKALPLFMTRRIEKVLMQILIILIDHKNLFNQTIKNFTSFKYNS